LAVFEPTLPKPWMENVAPLRSKCASRAHSAMQWTMPWPVGLLAAVRAASGDRLARDHAAAGVRLLGARQAHVRVHHPHHHLGVRPHVGGGDVVLGADVAAERVREAAGDALELAERVVARVELDAALGAAERDVVQRALVGHPRAERLDLVQRDLVVITHAALVRARARCCAARGNP
jgi:hypothetical protein